MSDNSEIKNLISEEKTLLRASLGFLVKDDQVLLAMKTQKIGKGCWNGYGGGIEIEETPEQSIVREFAEEAKITILPEYMTKSAIIDFHNTKSDGSCFICKVHVYLIKQWQNKPQETETMINPTWFLKKQLPLSKMMPADRVWLPMVLEGKKIVARFNYEPFQKELTGESEIREIDSFSD